MKIQYVCKDVPLSPAMQEAVEGKLGRFDRYFRTTDEVNCTVTLCHSRTENLKEVCAGADILVAALGKAEFVTADMVKPGAVVIDVGITRVPSDKTRNGWKLLGDVKFDEVAPKCSYITPVPGGVGPMTIVSLMKNTLLAAKGAIYSK